MTDWDTNTSQMNTGGSGGNTSQWDATNFTNQNTTFVRGSGRGRIGVRGRGRGRGGNISSSQPSPKLQDSWGVENFESAQKPAVESVKPNQSNWGQSNAQQDSNSWGESNTQQNSNSWGESNTQQNSNSWGESNAQQDSNSWGESNSQPATNSWGQTAGDSHSQQNNSESNEASNSSWGNDTGSSWNNGGGSRGRGGGRGRGGSGRACFNCGDEGHMSRECPTGSGGGGGSRNCYKCNESGHMARECPSGGGGGGGGSRDCYKCGESGHMARECPSGGGGGGGGSRNCYKCGNDGHISRDCPNGGGQRSGDSFSRQNGSMTNGSGGGDGWGASTNNASSNNGWGAATDNSSGDAWGASTNNSDAWGSSGNNNDSEGNCGWGGNSRGRGGRGRGGRGGSSGSCYKCGEEGHMSRECPSASGGGGDSGSRSCYKCGEEGHMSRECPSGGNDGGSGPRKCYKCGEEGHMSRECPSGGNDGGSGPRKCYKCGEEGHMSRECPTAGDGNGERKSGCHNCGEDGHIARDCTEPRKPRIGEDGEEKPAPMTYVPVDREVDDLFTDGLDVGIHFTQQQNIPVKVTGSGEHSVIPIKSFDQSNLRTLIMDNIRKARYSVPTPIQQYAIPIVLSGRDMMACAQTGSGKTAGFLLPMLHFIMANESDCPAYGSCLPISLIVSPTRELAIQIYDEARKFCNGSIIKVGIIYGGTAVFHQRKNIQNGCHILVATPGRLSDFIEKGYVSLSQIKFLVLDEADRMLDMGFLGEIQKIVNNPNIPGKEDRQTLMFSATFPQDIQNMAKTFLNDYLFVTVGMVGAANSDVKQIILNISKLEKRDTLITFINEKVAENAAVKLLVFVDKKRTADFLAAYLSGNDVNSTSIHGDRLQSQREQALRDFKTGTRNVLVATAVAARGLDIKGVGYVVNYDLPKEIDEYVHRIGRTGRVGNIGHAISYFDAENDVSLSKDLIKVLTDAQQEVPDFLREAGSGMGSVLSYEGSFMASDVRAKNGPARNYEQSLPPQMEVSQEAEENW